MRIHESGEMYLESIFILKKTDPHVRSIDIVNHTGYSKPSVSRAVGILKDGGYIVVDNDGYIDFTKEGQTLAANIYEKHVMLTDLFIKLGVDEKIAAEDACKIEHYISDETFEAIKKHIAKLDL